jgi:aminoglycoside 2''-phosphotransferase
LNSQLLINFLKQKYPQIINNKKIIVNTNGASNLVLEVEDQWIFRFPKTEYEKGKMLLEKQVLPHLKVPLKIPKFIYCSEQDDPYPFLAYKKIPGQGLPRDISLLSNTMIKSLGKFLAALHTFKWEKYLPPKNYMGEVICNWNYRYSLITQNCLSLLDPKIQSWVINSFEQFIKSQSDSSFKPSLVHGDFKRGNILYNDKEKKITGVIDFGSMGVGDPAFDFTSLHFRYGKSFTNKLLNYYKIKIDSIFFDRVEFYGMYGSFYRLLNGIQLSDHKKITKEITNITNLYNQNHK